MDALMICLIASAVAAFGGRWWLLAVAIATRKGHAIAVPGIGISAVAAAGLAAIAGGWIVAEVRGPGLLLFLALAILFAGASALWPAKPIPERVSDSARGPVAATILLLAAQLNDSAPFIILAAAAWTGDPVLAAVGGAVGLVAAAAGGIALSPSARAGPHIARWRSAIGIALLLLGAWIAVSAIGLV